MRSSLFSFSFLFFYAFFNNPHYLIGRNFLGGGGRSFVIIFKIKEHVVAERDGFGNMIPCPDDLGRADKEVPFGSEQCPAAHSAHTHTHVKVPSMSV